MSHITHFYHLAALDYLDVTTAAAGVGGPSVVMSPWAPQHLNRDSVGDVTALTTLRDILVGNYVAALAMRRKAHELGAEIGGKHPCQNAQVPGGMTTKPSTVNWANVVSLIQQIRAFIGAVYLPDLITVALAYGGLPPLVGNANVNSLFLQGFGCGNTLAYGLCPNPYNANTLLLNEGTCTCAGSLANAAYVGPVRGANEALITEHTAGSSHYSSPSQLHPSVGQTTPDMTSGYTWHKAPRFNNAPHEVGPLARMLASTLGPGPNTTVGDADLAALMTATYGTLGGTIECASNPGFADHLGLIPALGPLGAYTAGALTVTALGAICGALGAPVLTGLLFSTLGRHGARGLEAKFMADAIGVGAAGPDNASGGGGVDLGIPYINAVITDPNPGSDVYNYRVMPKSLKMGRGLTEAPRGALGHWITTEFRRIVNYQAVVPSTWNACGTDDLAQNGPIEQSLLGSAVGYVGDGWGTTADEMVNRVLRTIHPYDICIACSVHITDTKDNTIAKVRIDPDGRITREEVPAEA